MRVIHVTPAFSPAFRYGGPIVSVLRLCQSLASAGVHVEVVTTTADGPNNLDVSVAKPCTVEGVTVRYFRRIGRIDYAFAPAMVRYLLKAVKECDLVHVTSTFSFPATAASWVARAAGVPYIVSPRGSLQTWSLRQKRWKKLPYWYLAERECLRRAAALHATSEMERQAILRVLPESRVFVVPNGAESISAPIVSRSQKRLVFLGRIHKKKGFDVLIPALSQVARIRPDIETVVAGPNEDGEWQRVERLIASADPRPRVRYVGAVVGSGRFDLLASAAAFLLPSHSENFGLTVVEAMACETPVVVSRNCPWSLVEQAGAGYWVANTPDEFARAILMILGDRERASAMGKAGRTLAESFSWPGIGVSMAAHYRDVTGA